MDYEKELRAGREIVVISGNEKDNSAVFWMKGDTIYTWSREIGIIERSTKEYTFGKMALHFIEIKLEGGQVIARG